MNETARSQAAFAAYAAMGPKRSLAKLAAKLGYKQLRPLERWSKEHRWQERVVDYDYIEAEHTGEERRQLHQDTASIRAQMYTFHAEAAREAITIALDAIRAHAAAGTINADAAVKLLAEARKWEFEARPARPEVPAEVAEHLDIYKAAEEATKLIAADRWAGHRTA